MQIKKAKMNLLSRREEETKQKKMLENIKDFYVNLPTCSHALYFNLHKRKQKC